MGRCSNGQKCRGLSLVIPAANPLCEATILSIIVYPLLRLKDGNIRNVLPTIYYCLFAAAFEVWWHSQRPSYNLLLKSYTIRSNLDIIKHTVTTAIIVVHR